MSQQRLIPQRLTPPKAEAGWASSITNWINDTLYRILSDRIEALITQDVGTPVGFVTTNMGSRRYYFDSTGKKLYYDDGTWEFIGPSLGGSGVFQVTTQVLATTPSSSGSLALSGFGGVGVTIASNIIAFVVPVSATDDEPEADPIVCSGIGTGAGTWTLNWQALEGPIIGSRNIAFAVL